ncbi:hypothetical protein MKW94_000271, partial [Papaver nudicaule]|nr:hypothetical protein [Papaver nudicaule]
MVIVPRRVAVYFFVSVFLSNAGFLHNLWCLLEAPTTGWPFPISFGKFLTDQTVIEDNWQLRKQNDPGRLFFSLEHVHTTVALLPSYNCSFVR